MSDESERSGPASEPAPEPASESGPARSGWSGRWQAFRESPFFPAVTVALILAGAAGLFAGSYTYAMADPTPRRIPTAVVGQLTEGGEAAKFVAGMEKALGSSLDLRLYRTYAQARDNLEAQRVFAILAQPGDGRVRLDIASAAGASVAQVLAETAPKVGERAGVRVTVRDVKPLDEGDPRGLALFYISMAAVIVGFVGAIQLSVHASGLNPLERIGFTALYALLGGFVICAVENWLLGSVQLPFVHTWLILALTMFTSGMVFTMFNTLFGRWSMLPTWGLMVILGNPSSGGAVSWPLLPSVLGEIGRLLPPGASVNALHTAVYFAGHQHAQPYLVLAAWALVSCSVFWIWRHRHPGGRAPREPREPDPETTPAPSTA
ncbi:ABC transporter permease [Streptomyces sp. N2-109]|uniref:ABC transporter permease n=1 Tax=Streptomyces gossypii TaxID=2883101 RepID=A0ABT2JNM0_9ACTN|nr:ABC transporter permease [Streptomyces gossypii]MCT2589483.1 ABC transporter permease [Streptomyces gossypii]